MRVTVRLFARLRDIAGAAELTRELPAGRDDRRRVARSSRREFPALADYERSISCAVNADYARMDHGGRRRRRNRVPAAGVGRMTRSAPSTDRAPNKDLFRDLEHLRKQDHVR